MQWIRLFMANALNSKAFKLKGRLYTLTVLTIVSIDNKLLVEQLNEVVRQAPKMFQQAPIVLDCTEVSHKSFDLQECCNQLRQKGLIPIAIQGGNSYLNTLAQGLGLAVLNASSNHDKPLDSSTGSGAASKTKTTKTITTPVRSGQQIVSTGDLVVTSAVSHGAELLADGHIHIYGALRGRALAGIEGNKSARIFCQSLEAELVSIAGFYRLSDAIDVIKGPCQIFLQDDQIQIESI